MNRILCATVAISAVAVLGGAITPSPVLALTQKECGAKYQAAKSDGSLAGRTYAQYRKAECGAGATAATTAAPAPAPAPTRAAKRAPTAAAPATAGNAVFPSAVSPKYSNEKGGRARMHTCLDQYNANKASNANGGLRWIQKGGGYYSECNKRLKV